MSRCIVMTDFTVIPAFAAFRECRNTEIARFVIPAKAGIQRASRMRESLPSMDSRLRGNDGEETFFLNSAADFVSPDGSWKAPFAEMAVAAAGMTESAAFGGMTHE